MESIIIALLIAYEPVIRHIVQLLCDIIRHYLQIPR